MRTPLARLPSVVGSTSWGLRWNFSPHSRGAAACTAAACTAAACTSTVFTPGFSRAVLIISSVSRFLGLGASRKKERASGQEPQQKSLGTWHEAEVTPRQFQWYVSVRLEFVMPMGVRRL